MCICRFGTKRAVSIDRIAVASFEYSPSQMELCLCMLIKQLESCYAPTLGAVVPAHHPHSLSLSLELNLPSGVLSKIYDNTAAMRSSRDAKSLMYTRISVSYVTRKFINIFAGTIHCAGKSVLSLSCNLKEKTDGLIVIGVTKGCQRF